jgi:hypothetical protein
VLPCFKTGVKILRRMRVRFEKVSYSLGGKCEGAARENLQSHHLLGLYLI